MSIYIPLSQCTTNLFANPGEFIFASNAREYVGPYWKYITGATFAGATPQSTPKPLRIIPPNFDYPDASRAYQFKNKFSQVALNPPFDADPNFSMGKNGEENWDPISNRNYNLLKSSPFPDLGFNPEIKTIPGRLSPQPTEKDFENFEFTRFFVKKRNEILYYETSKEYYNPMKAEKKNYYWELYQVFPVTWRILGEISNVKAINVNIVHLTENKLNLPYFHLYIKDYLKYYGGDNVPGVNITSEDGEIPTPPQIPVNVKINRKPPSTGGLGY